MALPAQPRDHCPLCKTQFPDWDDELRQSFARETELLFETIMREDLSVLEMLTADFTFLNERLAIHYGIPNIYGSRFRRVELGPELDYRPWCARSR
ncbi:MAG: hypothetical protein CM1200mP40_06410 [Gammaproteobacteria bacterium]|nr:MAG: hypothetical protein CM1200mP40_06410 [Gammaproteobacteria bacterium]